MSGRLASGSSVSTATAFDARDVPTSVDLIEAAVFLLDFLSEISTKPELYQGPLVECAIQRYERYWLPLVAKHPGRLLPAPLDIEWVWHCHMLSPEAYSTDCSNIVGKVVDHHLMDRGKRKELMKDSERLWRKEYTDVPFSACDAVTPWFDCEFVSALTYHLSSAVTRQKAFFYQVSLPHYRDEKFLNNALVRYKKFLYLKRLNPGTYLVPCYDSHLLWHAHMLHPKFYKDDTQIYLGYLLPHDDLVSDRSSGSNLSVSETRTRNLWRRTFNEKYSYFGSMYRGEPPDSKLYVLSREDIFKVCTKQTDILIEKIRVTGLPAGKAYKLKLWYNTGYQNFNRCLYVTENIVTLKGNSRTFEENRINTIFQFDTRYNDKITASLRQKTGKLCLGSSDIVGEGKVDFLRKIQPLNNKGLISNDEIDCGDGLSIELIWSCPAPSLGPCVLRLEPGEYQSCVMPEDRETMWGPIPLPRLPPGVDSTCSVASHKLFNHTKKLMFTVRMIHSEPLLMSAIHVYYGEKLVSVAHLIVGDQLPLPSSVSDTKKSITLNPKEGQRAVLIKNDKGDWGVAVGWWAGFQRKVAGRKGSCSEGHLEVRFFNLPNNSWHYVSCDRLYSLATSKFQIGECIVEFDSGFIEIDTQRGDIAENLALVFSVALIHVLCQPRPVNWDPKLESPDQEEEPLPKLGGAEDITLLLAAGVLIATPCNQAIRNLFRKKKQHKLGEEYDMKQRNQKEADHYEQNSGQPAALHETDVSLGWGRGNADSNVGNVEPADTSLATGIALALLKHHIDKGSDKDDDERSGHSISVDAEVLNIADKTALLLNNEDADEDQGDNVSALNDSGLLQGDVEANELNSGEAGDDDDDDEVSDRESEGVFEVEVREYNLEAGSQVGLFGNGDDDSDEAEPEEVFEDNAEMDDEICPLNSSHESEQFPEGCSSSLELNGADDNDIENEISSYYDEFYNIEADDNVGFHDDDTMNSKAVNSNIWDTYGIADDTGFFANDNTADFGGFSLSKYEEADQSYHGDYSGDADFGKENNFDGCDAADGGYSDFNSGLEFDNDVDYGGAGSGGGIFNEAICSGAGGTCIEAGGGEGESGF